MSTPAEPARTMKTLRELIKGATPGPWRRHDMEHDAIVGPDRKAIALVMGRSRTEEEDAANLAFIVRANPATMLLVLDQLELIAAHPEEEAGEWGMHVIKEAAKKALSALNSTPSP